MAQADTVKTARANCAARYRARGQAMEAQAFAAGDRDAAWAMRHELRRLQAEQARG